MMGLAAGVAAADQLTKWWALQQLAAGASLPVIPGVFHLTLVHNRGVAFGLLAQAGWLVMLIALVVVAALLIAVVRRPLAPHHASPVTAVGLGLIAGGAVGNLLDRVRLGAVVDFLDFRIWPVFNLADSCITVGAIVMTWWWWRDR